MRILHVVSSLLPEDGGPSYTVPRLADALNQDGHSVQICTLFADHPNTASGVSIRQFKIDKSPGGKLAKLGRSRDMAGGMFDIDCDVLHTHGLWMMPNVYPELVTRRTGKPLILSPRGMLARDALKYSKLAKMIFWSIWQSRAVEGVNCFHATSEGELCDIRAFGLTAPVAVIPNGIDVPPVEFRSSGESEKFVLALGRLHPKKGLESLISAFARISSDFAEWKLRIAGFDQDGHSETLMRQIRSLGVGSQVSVSGAVVGIEKIRLMRDAAVFALPSLNENFAVTVAESLSVETPVISSKGAPWSRLEAKRCGWWVDHGIEPLAEALRKSMTLSVADRAEMGRRGREWMESEFSWESVARDMSGVYEWLLGRGSRPACVFV